MARNHLPVRPAITDTRHEQKMSKGPHYMPCSRSGIAGDGDSNLQVYLSSGQPLYDEKLHLVSGKLTSVFYLYAPSKVSVLPPKRERQCQHAGLERPVISRFYSSLKKLGSSCPYSIHDHWHSGLPLSIHNANDWLSVDGHTSSPLCKTCPYLRLKGGVSVAERMHELAFGWYR
ncbi:uncharacterized protein UV8b_06542 [Ustilaginoidea virens]|uniref:Uncharacterized protein n=1 Tax=Ustilaginoidea virens TaxID=1159556 RepID=A0A8E5HVI1_USTVR|nr:uncharacterized protein UV8b_06542 [Ustilaginoidea virens]QUC22301.1 hypothetical protein UV8b_06542 [Ustilaginoidea virens]